MAELGLKVRYPKKFKAATDSDHNNADSPNKLNRQFTVKTPNHVWTTDKYSRKINLTKNAS